MCPLSPWLMTWPWTLQASLCAAPGPGAYFMFVTSPGPAWPGDEWWPGSRCWPLPCPSWLRGHHNTDPDNGMSQLDTNSPLRHWDTPGPPTTTQWPSGIFRASSTWFLNFQWLDENTNLHWMDEHLVNIYSQFSKLENKSRICRVQSQSSFISPNFPADLPSQMLSGRAFSGNLSELNWTWIGSLSTTCLKHKLSLDSEKAENEGQIFNATRVIDIRIRSVTQQK